MGPARLPLMGVALGEELIARVLAEAARALGAYVTAEGTMAFELAAHFASGRRP